MKALITFVFIAALAYAGDNSCRSFYNPSISETHPILSRPDAVIYDVHAVGNSWANPFAQNDPSTFRTQIYSSFTVTRLRENPKTGKLPENVVNENFLYNTGMQSSTGLLFLLGENSRSLSQIYSNYAKQGPERSENIKTYQQEDLSYRDRTTHFLLQQNLETVGRIQLQHSLSPSQKLNVEAHFPDVAPKTIRSGPGKIFFELGRLHIPQPKKDGKGIVGEYERQLAFYELFLRPLMYAIKQAPEGAIVFQTNARVLATIRNRIRPYQLKEVSLISKPGEPLEYLTIIRPNEIAKLTNVFFLKRFQLILLNFLNSSMGELRFTIHPDERIYYDDLDVHSLTQSWAHRNYEPIFREHFKNALGPLRNLRITMNATFSLDTSGFINPHFISIGRPEAETLFERSQRRIRELF